MSFIRKIKKREKVYLAEVENIRVDGKVRQKHIRYIGREIDSKTILSSSHDLPEDIFANFSQLNQLFLESNQLITLPSGIFQGLNKLEALSIWGNQLIHLPADIFNHLNQLERLNLGINQLATLPIGIFNDLNQLKELYLNANQLINLPMGIFNHLKQLQTLELEYNQLNDTAILNLTQSFPYQVETLRIDNNYITDKGMAALVNVLPCSHLTTFIATPSLSQINDTSLLQRAQRELLEKVCSDRLCHANLPLTASCPANSYSSGIDTPTDTLSPSKNSPLASHLSHHPIYLSSSQPYAFGRNTLLLELPDREHLQNDSQVITAASSVVIIGSVGLGILFYKNCTLLQSIVNTGWNFVQQCFYGKEKEQTAAPATEKDSADIKPPPPRGRFYSCFASFFQPRTEINQQNIHQNTERPSMQI